MSKILNERSRLSGRLTVYCLGYFTPSVWTSYVDAPKERKISSITDFGCGTGGYVKVISDAGIYASGFDGNPSTGMFGFCDTR